MHTNKILKKQSAAIFKILFCLAISFCFCPPPEAPCSIGTLLLEESDPPDQVKWYTRNGPSAEAAPSKVGIEKIGIGYSVFPQGSVGQNVDRFVEAKKAHSTYSH